MMFLSVKNPGSSMLWVFLIVQGFMAGAMPIILAIPVELKAIGIALAGTAVGLMNMGSNITGFLFPLAGMSMLNMEPIWSGLFFGGIGFVLAGVLALKLTETGAKASQRRMSEQTRGRAVAMTASAVPQPAWVACRSCPISSSTPKRAATCARASDSPRPVARASASESSKAIANHFVFWRQIPPINVVTIDWKWGVESCSGDRLRQDLLQPIEQAIGTWKSLLSARSAYTRLNTFLTQTNSIPGPSRLSCYR